MLRWLALCIFGTDALRVVPPPPPPPPSLGACHERAVELVKKVYPDGELGDRVELGKRAQGLIPGSVLRPDDPEQDRTYGEFDLDGFGWILERATQNLGPTVSFCDVGSGTGRLVCYAAMRYPGWRVRGLEISPMLHDDACRRARRAEALGLVEPERIVLNRADVLAMPPDLSDVTCLFVYSTVFPAVYSPDYPYPILDEKWSTAIRTALGKSQEDRRVVTVDRALDPTRGFEVVDTIARVPNRETAGSVAYVHDIVR